MTLDEIKEKITQLHNGAAYNVTYKTAVQKLDGSDAWKVVRAAFRMGVRYSHLKQNVGKQVGGLPGNGHWIIDRYVYQDNNGLKLRVTNGAFGKRKIVYEDTAGNKLDPSSIKITKSKGFTPIVQAIKLENVIAIEKKGGDR